VADFTYRAVAIVRHDFGDQRDASRSVAFVHDFFELATFQLAGSLHDGALDVVGRHIQRFGVSYRLAKPGIPFGVSAADACGDGDFLNELGKGSPALRIDGGLFMLDTVPLGMAGHSDTPYKCVIFGHSLARSKRGRRAKRGRGN